MNNTPELIEQVKASLVNLETHNCDLQQRAKDLALEAKKEQEISAITTSIRKLYAGISEAAMSDNFDAMKAARAEVKKKEAHKADLEFQLTSIKNGQIKGDPKLLASVKEKYEAYLSADKELVASVKELCSFTYEYENAIEYLRDRRKYASSGYPPKIESVNNCICISVSNI